LIEFSLISPSRHASEAHANHVAESRNLYSRELRRAFLLFGGSGETRRVFWMGKAADVPSQITDQAKSFSL
jgi:hypothetical protein